MISGADLEKASNIRNAKYSLAVNLKHVAMQLCTCTWIEIMTGAGITLYMLYMHNFTLAAITVAAFGPLIGFHFAVDRIKKLGGSKEEEERTIRIKSLSGRSSWPPAQNTSSSTEIVRAQ